MEKILACRLCLSTNVKLFNMYKYRLDTAYENLTGFEMSPADCLQFACSMCSAMLLKSASFQQTCRSSQDLLKCAQVQQHLITTEYIQNLRTSSPYSNLKVQHNNTTVECTHIEQDLKEETCWDTWDCDDYIKGKDVQSSDEEPLSKIVVKKSRRNKSDVNVNDKPKKKKSNRNNDAVKLENKNDCNDDVTSVGGVYDLVQKDDSIDVIVKAVDVDRDNDDDFREGEVDIFFLTKEQQIEEVESRKTSLNYLNSFYKCDHCFKGFITDATYKNHMIRHDPSSGAHACEVCRTRWSSARALRAHVATSHERKFVCKLCNYICKSRHRAKEHSKWHSGHIFVCKFCGASFSKSTSHLTHIRLHHPSQHACDVCGESFIGETGLNMHKKKAHRDLKDPEAKAVLSCLHCGAQFRSVEALERHASAAAGQPCDLTLRPCLQCGEGFASEEELKDHLKVHSKEDPVKCDECNRTFAHERSYSVHFARAHAPPARAQHAHAHAARAHHVVCEICGKKCISNATLRYHQRTHTGERPYQCNECPKRFSVFQRLQIHHRTHTGERPYKCCHCPKAFKHKAALNRHDRVHTGAKPYACSHCGKAFSQSNSMKLHIRTVHLKMPSPYRARRLPPE